MKSFLSIALTVAMLFAMGCESEPKAVGPKPQSGDSKAPEASSKPVVVATTTMIASAAREIGGDAVDVQAIMKPGGDPHLYQPTPSDAKMITRSQVVLTSGLYLEGWLDDLVRNAGGERPVIVVSDGVKPITMEGSPGGVDPHFWFDLESWAQASDNVTKALVKSLEKDPDAAKAVGERGAKYKAKILALHDWTKVQLATVPKEQRVLITSHDAFNYFGRAYDIDVVGIQGASTEQEASQRDVANVIELVKERSAPAIFVESSVNPALIKQVGKETGVKVAGPLYSDSCGAAGTPEESFDGMFVSNIDQVVNALGGKYSAFEHKEK